MTESLDLFRATGDRGGIAVRLRILGSAVCAQGDFERASVLLEEGLALQREVDGTYAIALSLGALALVALYQGDAERAQRLLDEAMSLFRLVSHTYGVAWSLHYLGRVAHLRRDYDQGLSLLSKSLRMRLDLADRPGMAGSLEGLAAVALACGRPERAARLFATAATVRDAITAPLSPAERVIIDADLEAVCACLAENAFASAWAEGQAMTIDEAVAYALEAQAST